MHVTSVLDALGIKEIAEHTQTDITLTMLRDIVHNSKIYIPKNPPELQPFRNIFSKITVLNNRTFLKQNKIILATSVVEKALSRAHSEAHPGQNGLIRRLRAHLYIKELYKIGEEFENKCKVCQLFTQKTIKHPIELNRFPERFWDETSVDLFSPSRGKNHIVVLQDSASRYPVAKVIRSTNVKSVIPVLEDTYNTFSNPQCQKSENSPPFI